MTVWKALKTPQLGVGAYNEIFLLVSEIFFHVTIIDRGKCYTAVCHFYLVISLVIYNYHGKGMYQLQLQLGETVQILEESSGKNMI